MTPRLVHCSWPTGGSLSLGVTEWIAQVHQQAANIGEVRTLFGRRRSFPNIYSANDALD